MIIVTGIDKNIREMLEVKIYKFIKSRYTVRSFKSLYIQGVPQKKRQVHSSLIYRRILIIYTPN
jgi:hypothetical protein